MEKSPLISIIVPIYKVEQYLRRCVDSILAQTYTNIEVILIDDGSPDGCPAICDEYAAKDSRVVVIHQKNAGVSAARNVGLDVAKGDYIGFVDSDDWIEPDMYEVLLDLIINNNADIASINMSVEYHFPANIQPTKGSTNVYYGLNALKDLCLNGKVSVNACSKLISEKILKNIRFSLGLPIGEDKLFCMQMLGLCNTYVYLDYSCYHYFQRESSAVHSNNYEWALNRIQRENQYYSYLSTVFKDEIEYADLVALSCAMFYTYDLWYAKKLTRENYKTLMKHIKPHKNTRAIKMMSRKTRLFFRLLLLGRVPYILARNMSAVLRKT